MTRSELLRAIYRATHDTDVTYSWRIDTTSAGVNKVGNIVLTFNNLSEEDIPDVKEQQLDLDV
jgi:hypothetical protein